MKKPRAKPRPFHLRHTHGDGCWEWLDSRGGPGYGQLTVDGKPWAAHRYAWTLANGPIPDGLHILHRCNNRGCVRPDHLYVGTNADNARDRMAAGTSGPRPGVPGERQWNAKLTEADVIDIRRRRDAGEILRTIAADHGITIGATHHIANRKSWRHVPY